MTADTERRVTGFLGLCTRAGQTISGQEQCVAAIRAGQAALVLMDADASPNTKKRLTDACAAHGTPIYEISAGALGRSIGRGGRMVAALRTGGMAERMTALLKDI